MELFVADAEAFHDAGAEVLDDRVGSLGQGEQLASALGGLEVENNAAFAPIDALEISPVVPLFVVG